ncbi:hypothetical protein CBR_g6272 [Chara braunii]|uniref:Uncharacterized protein n=1 Tax=Chara braunii TaxID=69332 RepID=A0A388KJA9_CHABU|nr:hypothetical protein CBR_g6272 [Chara braunii]|eukprot:GBG70141.1 hypothetical protein CBR_g6272 [Chara braunii]
MPRTSLYEVVRFLGDMAVTLDNSLVLLRLYFPPGRCRKRLKDGEKRVNNRSKLYRDKLWALDWVSGTNEATCGAVVFLTEDEGTTWYCCAGIMRSEIDKATTEKGKVDERDLRKFFLISVYDDQGTDWVKTDQKVSLDLALFNGYGQKTFAIKAFDVKGDQLALAGYPTRGIRRRGVGGVNGGRPSGSCDLNVGWEAGGGCGARFGDDGEDDEQEGECGSGGGREHDEGGDNHCDVTVRHTEWERGVASGGMDEDGMVGGDMEAEELEEEGGDIGVSAGQALKGRGKREAKVSPTSTAPKKQARRKTIDEARVALDTSQGTSSEPVMKREASGRVCRTSEPKKNMRSLRRPKSDDSSNYAERVDPRVSTSMGHGDDGLETNKPSPINMAQCFFLKYDEQGRKRKNPPRVVIDVMQILQTPEGDIAFNQ